MPNWVINELEFYGTEEAISQIIEAITDDTNRIVDFNKIIPMPDDVYTGPVGPQERMKYGNKNWYDWCIDNWGTKWNACDSYVNKRVVSFETAWCAPENVINKIADMFFEYEGSDWIDYKFADEDIGSYNCGHIEFYEDGYNDLCEDSADFAASVWGYESVADYYDEDYE